VNDSISKLSLFPFESTRTETVVKWIRWDSHRHSADGRPWKRTLTAGKQKISCIPLTKNIHKINAPLRRSK